MYDHIFTPKSLFGKELLQQWSKYYTSDVNFLKDNQKLVKNLNIQIVFHPNYQKIFGINGKKLRITPVLKKTINILSGNIWNHLTDHLYF